MTYATQRAKRFSNFFVMPEPLTTDAADWAGTQTQRRNAMKDQLRDIMVVVMGLGLCAFLVFLGAA